MARFNADDGETAQTNPQIGLDRSLKFPMYSIGKVRWSSDCNFENNRTPASVNVNSMSLGFGHHNAVTREKGAARLSMKRTE